ncbi:MAG: hypothetical protein IE926_05765 [Micrococcales bacterium]|nr:hypothetical protein [Micrococcales bacterium]
MTSRLTGSALTKLRRWWAPRIAEGTVKCWRCGHPIKPGQPWDLGHRTDHALGGHRLDLHPEHRHTKDCPIEGGGNRSAGARLGNQLRRGRRARRRIEEWL